MRRTAVRVASTLVTLGLILAAAPAAQAATGGGSTPDCAGNFSHDLTTDVAYTTVVWGSCLSAARHRYANSSGLHWTIWRPAVSPAASELAYSAHKLGVTVFELYT